MKRLYIFVLLFISGCTLSYKDSDRIIRRLKTEGKTYFNHLVTTQKYEWVLDRIEEGDLVFIKGAPILKKWVDASTGLSLDYSLSRAVIKRPDEVMALIPSTFSVSEICTIPYIEESKEVESKHIMKSLSALKSSSNSTRTHIKCIEQYEKLIKNIK